MFVSVMTVTKAEIFSPARGMRLIVASCPVNLEVSMPPKRIEPEPAKSYLAAHRSEGFYGSRLIQDHTSYA